MGAFLCLNIVVALIAIVRVSGIRYHGNIDYTWIFFWQHIEVCVAISMVSLTAFRSLFVTTKRQAAAIKAKPWYSSQTLRLRATKREKLGSGGHEKLPSIPSATITGMRTFIRGGQRMTTLDSEAGHEHSEGTLLRDRDHITVTNIISSEPQAVCKANLWNTSNTDEQCQEPKHPDSLAADFV